MSLKTEGDNSSHPEPGQPDTVTISRKEYVLLIDVANTVIRMARALEDFEKPKTLVGFQPPHSRFDTTETSGSESISITELQP